MSRGEKEKKYNKRKGVSTLSELCYETDEENLEESKKLLQEIETAKAKLELPEVKEKSKCETIIDIIGTILCGVIVISVALLLFGVG